MINGLFKTSTFVGISVVALTFVAGARAEEQNASKTVWKTPQVVGSAPVKEEPKSRDPQLPRAVGTNAYGPRNMNNNR